MPKPSGSLTAVIVSGGKQYRVALGDRILVDRLSAEPGSELRMDRVLLVADGASTKVGLHELPVVFCIDRAGITGDNGPSHHGVLDLALLLQVPGMTVFAPSSAQELQAMLPEALAVT